MSENHQVTMIDFNITLAELSVAEKALRDEPYERLPCLAGTLQLAQLRMESLRQETLELRRVLHVAREAYRDWQTLKTEWLMYLDHLQKKYPPPDGEAFELTCPHHQRIDKILFPQTEKETK